MTAALIQPVLLAAGSSGLLFTLQQSTGPARVILFLLFVGSIFSWSVMITKLRVLRRAGAVRTDFLKRFRAERQPLKLFTERARFDGTPIFAVYKAGCRELTFQLLGSAEVDETFRARLEIAQQNLPRADARHHHRHGARRGRVRAPLESQMILLATAVSGAPFLGLLGTVWGVMETFGDVAAAGSANLAAMAPGVSAALITTVTGLLVAIPAMFGYNFLVTTVRGMVVELDNFAAELSSEFEHKYVDHRAGEPALEVTPPCDAFPTATRCTRSPS